MVEVLAPLVAGLLLIETLLIGFCLGAMLMMRAMESDAPDLYAEWMDRRETKKRGDKTE